MKKIIKYELNENGTIPNFVSDGGYFPSGDYLVGVSVEDDSQIPEGIEIFDKADLVSHVAGLNLSKKDPENPLYFVEMSTEEKEASVDEWLDQVGMSDLE